MRGAEDGPDPGGDSLSQATGGGASLPATLSDGLRLGAGTFTRLPVRPPRVIDTASGRVALLTAPLWGGVLGVIAGGFAGALWWWFTRGDDSGALAALLCAAVVVVALAWLTRGLHLDGLADTFDGFASMRRGTDALAVMRDPNIGALGAVGLMLVMLLQVISLAVLVTQTDPRGFVLVVTAVAVVSRGVLPWLVRASTPASDSGLGAVVVGAVPPTQALAATTLSSLAAAALLVAAGLGAVTAVLATVAALVAAILLRRSALRRFGVLSGDILGAAVEVAATAALLVTAVAA